MTIQEQLHQEIDLISQNPVLRNKALYLLENLRRQQPDRGNMKAVLSLAGTLDDESAREITDSINKEFGRIDGEWR